MRKQLLVLLIAALTLIAVSAKANSGDFSGGVAIGSGYAGVDTAPTDGLLVQGNVGIGTASPAYALDVQGTAGSTAASNGFPLINKVNVQTFTSSGTYTPTTGAQYCLYQVTGGGGGGGGTGAANGQSSAGAGGGGGSTAYGHAACSSLSGTITIGGGGSGGAAGVHAGSSGSNTSIGTFVTGEGGPGGTGSGPGTVTAPTSLPGAGATACTGTYDVCNDGSTGQYGFSAGTISAFSGAGGAAGNGNGGAAGIFSNSGSTAGTNGSGCGAGAAGAVAFNTTTTRAGGNGASGCIVITEFISN